MKSRNFHHATINMWHLLSKREICLFNCCIMYMMCETMKIEIMHKLFGRRIVDNCENGAISDFNCLCVLTMTK